MSQYFLLFNPQGSPGDPGLQGPPGPPGAQVGLSKQIRGQIRLVCVYVVLEDVEICTSSFYTIMSAHFFVTSEKFFWEMFTPYYTKAIVFTHA